MNLFAISSLSVAVSCVVLSLLTLFYCRTSAQRILLFFNIACAVWGLGSFLAGIAGTEPQAILGWKITHLGGFFIAPIFYHLVITITEIGSRKLLYFAYAQAILFNILGLGTPYVFHTTRYVFDIYYNSASQLYSLAVLFYLSLVFLSFYQLFKFARKTKGYKHTQILYFIFGFLFGFTGGTSTLLPQFHIDILYPSGNFGVTLYCFVVTYAILRYRLMDIHIVMKKSLVYSFLASLLTGLFIVLVLVLTEYVSDVTEVTSFTIAVFSALVIAFLFAPLKNRIQSVVDKVFYKTAYDYYATVQKISHDLASTIELRQTFRLIVDTVFETLKLESVYLLSDSNGLFKEVYFRHDNGRLSRENSMSIPAAAQMDGNNKTGDAGGQKLLDKDSGLVALSKIYDVIIREELPILIDRDRAKRIEEELALYKGEVAAPVFIEDKVTFLLILGEKLSGDIFSNEDINLIDTIANQSAIALKNAMLYDELEQRIKERTAELSRANKDLQKEVAERKLAEGALKRARDELEVRVQERTKDLTEAVQQLNEEVIGRKRIQEELGKTAEEWLTTFDSANDVIMLIDSENRVIRANKACRNFFHLPISEIREQPVTGLFQAAGLNEDIEPLTNIKGSKKHEESEILFSEKKIWLLVTADPILDSKNNVTGAVCVIRDITERKRAEEERASLENQLLQVQKMDSIGRLAGGVAHDFNNLLSAIISYSYLCLMKLPQDSPVRAHLKSIKDTGERAAALTHQLLAFSRKQVLEMRDVNLAAVVRDIEKILSRLIGEDIEIEIKDSGNVGYINADPVQIEQVIMNLAVNARDAMPDGGRLVIETADVRVDRQSPAFRKDVPPGSYTMISVTDTGEGMSGDVKDKIFEPFFTTKEKGKGTGMGLATVYGVVRQHKGHVLVDSSPGRGTTFSIYFPSSGKVTDSSVIVRDEAEELLRGDETILAVDDETLILETVRDTLQPLGYRVLAAPQGTEALQICDTFSGNINLLLTDVIMPGLNGRELAERFLKNRRDTKVIYMSGYIGDVIGRHGVLDSGIAFLQKPLSPVVLARKVREVLDDRIKDVH